MEYNIRLANENDIDSLCNIRNNKELFMKYILEQDVSLVIAEENDRALGFAVLKFKGTLVPKLSDLFVHEKFRGYGVGSGLIKYREDLARGLGFSEIFVSVDPIENPKMLKLVINLGYIPISEPYSKTAIYYHTDGTPYEKTYIRADLKKSLSN